MISLKQLRYLVSVVEHGHFGKAAEACSVTQPALSMQIQGLERELGVELVERGARGVIATAAGRDVASRAARVLGEVREIGEHAKVYADGLSGLLHMGVIPTIAPYVLPPLLPLVSQRRPDLRLNIRETRTETLVELLLNGTLDLILLALPVDHHDVETLALKEDKLLLATPPAYQLKNRVEADPDLFAEDQLLLLEEGHCLRDQALDFCRLQKADNINVFGASSLSTIVQMVANGMGLTLLPEISVPVEARHAGIKLVRFAIPEPGRTLGLAWRKTSPRAGEFAELGDLIRQCFEQVQKSIHF